MKDGGGKLAICWAYLAEVVAAGLLYVLLILLFGVDGIARFVGDTASEWDKLTLALFSASLALWSWYSNVASSEFGGYLRHKGQHQMYAFGIAWALCLFLLATILLICAKGIDHRWVRNAGMLFLLYGGVSMLSLTRNALALFELHGEFKRQMRQIENDEKRNP